MPWLQEKKRRKERKKKDKGGVIFLRTSWSPGVEARRRSAGTSRCARSPISLHRSLLPLTVCTTSYSLVASDVNTSVAILLVHLSYHQMVVRRAMNCFVPFHWLRQRRDERERPLQTNKQANWLSSTYLSYRYALILSKLAKQKKQIEVFLMTFSNKN